MKPQAQAVTALFAQVFTAPASQRASAPASAGRHAAQLPQ